MEQPQGASSTAKRDLYMPQLFCAIVTNKTEPLWLDTHGFGTWLDTHGFETWKTEKDKTQSQQQVKPHEHMESDAATKTNTSDYYRELMPLLRHTRKRNNEAVPFRSNIHRVHILTHGTPHIRVYCCLAQTAFPRFPRLCTSLTDRSQCLRAPTDQPPLLESLFCMRPNS